MLRHHIRIMHFSGNTDGAVPTLGTERWIEMLGWDIIERYHPYMVNDQVAGFIERRDGIDFATVHGVGHMAPQWKKEEMTYLINT